MLRQTSLWVICIAIVTCATFSRAQFVDASAKPLQLQSLESIPNPLVADFLFSATVPSPNASSQITSISYTDRQVATGAEGTRKNGLLAAGLSLILPGLGEYYVGDQAWRGAIFTGIEIGLWYGRFHFNARGDDSNSVFHAWGDSMWHSTRYVAYLDSLMRNQGRTSLVNDPNNFSQVNAESDTLTVLGFTGLAHNLPQRGSEDYYQMLAEYVQFVPGWADDISHIASNSRDFQRYIDLSANTDHQYEIANDFLYGIILNHVLSAIDAALCAKDHNSAIRLHGELHQVRYPDGTLGYMPTAGIEMKF
jgi:hypothetical protein